MDFPSIADAVAKATPNVAELLDRHAKRCAQMCRNVPSVAPETCRNLPPADAQRATERAETCRNAPEPAGTCHVDENGGTNPTAYRPAPRPLSDRQLSAARLLVRGYGSVEIARHLGVNRHTVAVWKRKAAFVIELQRLRAYETASVFAAPARRTAPVPPPRPAPPQPAPVRMTRQQIEQEDRECEAMIEQMLRARARR